MNPIKIIIEKCIGCGICADVCPESAINLAGGYAQITENCTYCGICVDSCSEGAIINEKKRHQNMPGTNRIPQCQDIWVFAECIKGKLQPVVYELLGEANRLTKGSKHKVAAILLSDGNKEIENNLIDYGADIVYSVNGQIFEPFREEPYVDTIETLCKKHAPLVILFGATAIGRSLAPRVAARLRTGLSADCTSLELKEDGILIQTRPAFGGNLFANIICPYTRPQLVTVRPRVMDPIERVVYRSDSVIKNIPLPPISRIRTKVLEVIEQIREDRLEDAKIIVCAGLGVTNKNGLNLVKRLAEIFNGTFAATRKVVDLGWVSSEYQVGQTGKTVSPELYIACGVSGAVQHIVGMKSSKLIVGINIDPDAPIFGVSDIGIVGDLFEILPYIIEGSEVVKGD